MMAGRPWKILCLSMLVSACGQDSSGDSYQLNCPLPRLVTSQSSSVPYPELSCLTCPHKKRMMTLPANLNKFGTSQTLKTTFVNKHASTIIVWEEDYDGKEKLIGTFDSGQEFSHETIQGKVMRAYSSQGNQLLLEYMPGVKVIENLNAAVLTPDAGETPPAQAKPARRQEVNKGFRKQGDFAPPPNVKPDVSKMNCGFCFYNSLPVKVKVFFTGDGIHEVPDTEPDPGFTWCGCTSPDSKWVVRSAAGQELMRPSFRKVLIPHSCGLPEDAASFAQTNVSRALRGKFFNSGGDLIP